MSECKALIVDDEPDIRELLEITLGRMGLQTMAVPDLASARQRLDQESYGLCLTDMRLPDGDGIELVEHIQTRCPGLPVAVITAYGNMDVAIRALKAGAFDFISKPVDLEGLRRLVQSALKTRHAQTGNPPAGGPRLVGSSEAMLRLRETIDKLARSQAPVYISGESGTGKELVARLIHAKGPRAEQPFVPVNCGAIPAELMESELFGHKKGSFTGAVSDRAGLFQTANGGTLFLDEVADLPLHMQVKLLRAIQEKAVRPVGAQREDFVDVRILSATHKNLAQLVKHDQFREDLYYRINVIELRVPSLRERPRDILELAEFILDRLAPGGREGRPRLAEDAVQALMAYSFPGNVRELENTLERAMTLCEGHVIRERDLRLPEPDALPMRDDPGGASLGDEAGASGQQFPRGALPKVLGDMEKNAILQALEETRWNRTAAAKKLGLTLRQLRYRLKKLGYE